MHFSVVLGAFECETDAVLILSSWKAWKALEDLGNLAISGRVVIMSTPNAILVSFCTKPSHYLGISSVCNSK